MITPENTAKIVADILAVDAAAAVATIDLRGQLQGISLSLRTAIQTADFGTAVVARAKLAEVAPDLAATLPPLVAQAVQGLQKKTLVIDFSQLGTAAENGEALTIDL